MFEANSENNLLANHNQQYNFDESIEITPVQLNHTKTGVATNISHNSKSSLGQFEAHKLSYLLSNQEQGVEYSQGISHYGHEHPRVIGVMTIDEDSNVVQIGQQFTEIMAKYATNQIAFIVVVGDAGAGKSFYCDRVLNLAEVKGNHYSSHQLPGIYMFEKPFVKDGLNIFMLEVSNCRFHDDIFKVLNVMSIVLGSAYIYISNIEQAKQKKSYNEFVKSFGVCLKAFEVDTDAGKQIFETITVPKLYLMSRNGNSPAQVDKQKLIFFSSTETLSLPNAAANQSVSNQQLSSCSFLAKEFVSPAYVKEVSKSLKHVVSNLQNEKKLLDLSYNGNIVNKLVQRIAARVNSHHNVDVEDLYRTLVSELYISAYNYCVISYHDELESYFDDQQPKNLEQMLTVLARAHKNALDRFDEFNLSRQEYEMYQRKLIDHINTKENLICSINMQKTRQALYDQLSTFSRKNSDAKQVLAKMRQFRPELDHGRAEALRQVMVDLLENNQGSSAAHRLSKLNEEKQILQKQFMTLNKKNNEQQQVHRKKYEQIDKKEQEIDKQIKTYLQKNSTSPDKIDANALNKLKSQLEKLRQRQRDSQQKLNNFKTHNQDASVKQACETYQQKINSVVEKSKHIEKELEELTKSQTANPETKSPQKAKQATAASKIKQSEVKKPDVKKSEPAKPVSKK